MMRCRGISLKAFPAQLGNALELLSNCVRASECVYVMCVCMSMHMRCVCA